MKGIIRGGLYYALRNIARTPIRSFLTITSISFAIGLYGFLTSLTQSYEAQMHSIVEKGDVDIIVQSKFSATPISSSISMKQVSSITSNPLVYNGVGIVIGKVRMSNSKAIIYLIGLDDFAYVAQRFGLTLTEGRVWENKKSELIVASRLLRMLHLELGDKVPMTESLSMHIVGSYETWLSMLNSTMVCSAENARKILDRPNKINMLFLSLKSPDQTRDMIQWINKKFPNLHAIKSGELSSSVGIIKNLAVLMKIVAAASLLVAIAILINTFLVVVQERIQEIGILGAIGWPKSMIVYIFTLESMTMALIGGILGLSIAAKMLTYIRVTYVGISFYLPDSLSGYIWMTGIGMSLLVGMLGALIPAIFAAYKPIAKALKNEH